MEIAIIGLAGVALGACSNGIFMILQAKIYNKNLKEKNDTKAFVEQYISLYKLEQLYASKVASLQEELNKVRGTKEYSESDLSVKKEFRNKVYEETNVVITLTEKKMPKNF